MVEITYKFKEFGFDEEKEAKIKKELEIDRIIKTLPKSQSSLPYSQKREFVLKKLNIQESLDLQNCTIILFNKEKIRKERQAKIEEKISKIPDKNLTDNQKLFKVLNELNSSESYESDKQGKEPSIDKRAKSPQH